MTRHTEKVYTTDSEHAELKDKANRAHLSVSRYLLLKGLDAMPNYQKCPKCNGLYPAGSKCICEEAQS